MWRKPRTSRRLSPEANPRGGYKHRGDPRRPSTSPTNYRAWSRAMGSDRGKRGANFGRKSTSRHIGTTRRAPHETDTRHAGAHSGQLCVQSLGSASRPIPRSVCVAQTASLATSVSVSVSAYTPQAARPLPVSARFSKGTVAVAVCTRQGPAAGRGLFLKTRTLVLNLVRLLLRDAV